MECPVHGQGGCADLDRLPHYSTSWDAAACVIDKFDRVVVSKFPEGWRCYVWPAWAEGSEKPGFVADADAGPAAICRAALDATRV